MITTQLMVTRPWISLIHLIKDVYPYAPKIHLIIDNAGYFTGQIIQEWLKNNPRIELHFLPPDNPNLSPIERLWKVFHEHVSNNQYYASGKEFKEAVFNFFNKTLPNIAHTLVDRINDNFQILNNVPSV